MDRWLEEHIEIELEKAAYKRMVSLFDMFGRAVFDTAEAAKAVRKLLLNLHRFK